MMSVMALVLVTRVVCQRIVGRVENRPPRLP